MPVITKFDLVNGYWQIGMRKEARELTAFKSHVGIYEFLRMPFGLCNAGATFQRVMDKVLEGQDAASAYIDDVMVASKNFEQHLKDLEGTLSKFREVKVKVKTKKTEACMSETKFLGFIIT